MTHHSFEPWTVTRLLDWTAQYLAQKSVESPRLDAEVLLAHALQVSRSYLFAYPERELKIDQIKIFLNFKK